MKTQIKNGQMLLIILFLAAASGCSLLSGKTKSSYSPNTGGLYQFEESGNCGYINTSGDVVIKAQFDKCKMFTGGLAAVSVSEDWGFIDSAGKFVVNPQYAEVTSFSDGLAGVKTYNTVTKDEDLKFTNLWGFIDKTGKMVIQPQYAEIGPTASSGAFSGNLAAVKPPKGKFGYINKSGEMVIEPKFDGASDFINGIAIVRFDKDGAGGESEDEKSEGRKFTTGYINTKGEYIRQPSE